MVKNQEINIGTMLLTKLQTLFLCPFLFQVPNQDPVLHLVVVVLNFLQIVAVLSLCLSWPWHSWWVLVNYLEEIFLNFGSLDVFLWLDWGCELYAEIPQQWCIFLFCFSPFTHNMRTYHLGHFKVAFSTFTVLYVYLVQNISIPPKIPYPLAVTPHAHPSAPGNH